MLHGNRIALRARLVQDVAVLHAELHEDVATRSRAGVLPWIPLSAEAGASPYAVGEARAQVVPFSVVELEGETLVGEAALWGIDLHNRRAHLGMSLRPSFRGQGLGTDVVATLCRYGFTVRGLHRLQIETLADNTAMIRAATRNGFTQEGTLRQAAWVTGEFLDEVIYGLLAAEWNQDRGSGEA